MLAGAFAQTHDFERTRWLPSQTSGLQLDSLTVIPSSVQLFLPNGIPVDTALFWFDGASQQLNILPTVPADSVRLVYRVLPVGAQIGYHRKDTNLIVSQPTSQLPLYDFSKPTNSRTGFEPFSGLQKSGALSRAISVGNSQDAVLNSNLNLQLAGDLGNQTQIRASITDNTLPIQPDGSTQNLREFDRVYLELTNQDFGQVRAGDFNIGRAPAYFLNYDKRVSGAGVTTAPIKLGSGKLQVDAVGSLARGKFARNQFQGREGNQGPYRLQGTAGELFIIIISGSERVYIDGVLMKRGQEYDYVMDYNTGELTFTALRPITKDRRISVEFQYTEQNFLRTLGAGAVTYEGGKWRHALRLYSEQDNPNQALREELTDPQKQILALAGADPNKALVPSFFPQTFDPERPLYRLTDSLGVDSIFVYSNNPNDTLYQVSFTLIGPNGGDYILDNSSVANGRVFKWVPPVAGVAQGQYRPVRRLPVPTQLQVLSFETGYDITKDHAVNLQVARSNNVVNRLSEIPGSAAVGWAGKLGYNGNQRIGKAVLEMGGDFEWVAANFQTVERIRNIEFQRDWNLNNITFENQQLSNANISIAHDSGWQVGYALQQFSNGEIFDGYKHQIQARIAKERTTGNLQASWLSATDTMGNSQFFRERSSITHYWKPKFYTGLQSEAEYNRRQAMPNAMPSYWFFEGLALMGVGDTSKNFIEWGYFRRSDDTLVAENFEQASLANGIRIRGKIKSKSWGQLDVQSAYRTLRIAQNEGAEVQNNITGRLRYNHQILKNLMAITGLYETGIGSEPVRNLTYIRVPAGTGTHTWNDYNSNGIPELDEFEPARFADEATYVRTFLLGNVFQRTSIIKVGGSLSITPKNVLKGEGGWSKFINRWSTLTNLQTDQQNLLTGNTNNINPFAQPAADTLVVAGLRSVRNSVFFNRGILKFGGDYTYQLNETRNLLSFGIEGVRLEEHILNVRYQFASAFQLRSTLKTGGKENSAPGLAARNYNIALNEILGALIYQPGNQVKVTTDYRYGTKENLGGDAQTLEAHQWGLEFSLNNPKIVSLDFRLDYIDNRFEGAAQTPVGFEMLNGLRNGRNLIWRSGIQKSINNYLQISLSYEGRTAPNRPTVHLGSFQVKALF